MKKIMALACISLFVAGNSTYIQTLDADKSIVLNDVKASEEQFEVMLDQLIYEKKLYQGFVRQLFKNKFAIATVCGLPSLLIYPALTIPVTGFVYYVLDRMSPRHKYKFAKNSFIEVGKEYRRIIEDITQSVDQHALIAYGTRYPCTYLIVYMQEVVQKIEILDSALEALNQAREYIYEDDCLFQDCKDLVANIQAMKKKFLSHVELLQGSPLYVEQSRAYLESLENSAQRADFLQARQQEAWERAQDRKALVKVLRVPKPEAH